MAGISTLSQAVPYVRIIQNRSGGDAKCLASTASHADLMFCPHPNFKDPNSGDFTGALEYRDRIVEVNVGGIQSFLARKMHGHRCRNRFLL